MPYESLFQKWGTVFDFSTGQINFHESLDIVSFLLPLSNCYLLKNKAWRVNLKYLSSKTNVKKKKIQAGKMAQLAKTPVTKSDDLRLIPNTHMTEGNFQKLSSNLHVNAHSHTYTHVYTQDK